jgi:hypothetical protein
VPIAQPNFLACTAFHHAARTRSFFHGHNGVFELLVGIAKGLAAGHADIGGYLFRQTGNVVSQCAQVALDILQRRNGDGRGFQFASVRW